MISIYDSLSAQCAFAAGLSPVLQDMLLTRRQITDANGVTDLTHYLIVEPGDTEADIEQELGFSPLVNPFDGKRHGEEGFHPFHDWLGHEDGWYELIVAVGDFAYVLLIKDDPGTNADLLALCSDIAA